jgi:hypothetical protein
VTGNPNNQVSIERPDKKAIECASCEALWREHANALIAHLEAIDELELAQFEENGPRTVFLKKVVSFAKRSREETMAAVIAHRTTHLQPFACQNEMGGAGVFVLTSENRFN